MQLRLTKPLPGLDKAWEGRKLFSMNGCGWPFKRNLTPGFFRVNKGRRCVIDMKNSVILFLLLAILWAGCAARGRLSPAYIFYQGEPVEIEMEDFSFKPNHLSILRNESPIILHLKNRDGISHNFTLMAADRDIISSQDLESKESVTVNLGFLNLENYSFYCFFHQYRGMKGMLMVD